MEGSHWDSETVDSVLVIQEQNPYILYLQVYKIHTNIYKFKKVT